MNIPPRFERTDNWVRGETTKSIHICTNFLYFYRDNISGQAKMDSLEQDDQHWSESIRCLFHIL